MDKLKWEAVVNDWELIDIDSYKLFLSEADKLLKDITDDSEKITTRVYGVIGILIIIYSAIIGALIKYISDDEYRNIIPSFCIEALILSYVFYKLYKLIRPREIFRIGTAPKEIFVSKYYDKDEYEGDDKIKRVYLHIIEQYQDKIDRNEDLNQLRIKDFNSSLQWIIYSLLGVIIFLAIVLSPSIF